MIEKNTKKNCTARFLIYKEKKTYTAICLDFNIIEEHTSFQTACESIIEAAQCHFLAVLKNNLPDKHLNTPADQKFWNKYIDSVSNIRSKGDLNKKETSKLKTYSIPVSLLHKVAK